MLLVGDLQQELGNELEHIGDRYSTRHQQGRTSFIRQCYRNG